MAKNKQIYMSPALMELETEMKESGGSFSARLGEIVERYDILIDLEEVLDFSEKEMEILSECICGATIDRRKVRGLHLDVLDAASGTPEIRSAVSAKIEKMTAGQRITLIEKMGQ